MGENTQDNFEQIDLYSSRVITHEHGDFHIETHWHDSLELIYCIFGSLTIKINSQSHPLSQGTILLINTGQFHSIESSNPFCILSQNIKLSNFGSYSKLVRNYIFDTDYSEANAENLFELKTYMEKLDLYKKSAVPNLEFKVNIAINNVILLLLEKFREEDAIYQSSLTSQKHIPTILTIIEYINQNYKEKITLQSVSEYFSYSEAYFSKYFKKYTGLGFSEYIRNIRLIHASNDLFQTDLPIFKIAENNGFPNTKSFTVAFKRKYGMTPKRYMETTLVPEKLN